MNDDRIWACLSEHLPPVAVAGIMGNLYAESGLNPCNLQNSGNTRLGMTDEVYTQAVDCGEYDQFSHDGCGYGLAQWTYPARKEALLSYAKACGTSIGDIDMQLRFLWSEMRNQTTLITLLRSARTVREASDAVLTLYERPSDQSESVRRKRAVYGQRYYDQFAGGNTMTINYDKYLYSTGTHYIANSGSDENKQYKGGKAGDQTGHEAELKKWYNRPWTVVLRYPVQAVALEIAKLSIAMCLNDKVGYDQNQRNTYWKQLQAAGYDPSKITVACEEDCTAGVSANVKCAGHIFNIKALEDLPLCTSRNMRTQFTKAGFVALTDKKFLTSYEYLLPGDILLYENHHAACNVTLGKKVKDQWNPDYQPHSDEPDEPDEPDVPDEDDNDDEWEVEPPFAVITGSSVNVRKGPSVSYGVIGHAHKGDELHYFGYTLTDEDESWVLVEFEQQTGWVSGKYTKVEE